MRTGLSSFAMKQAKWHGTRPLCFLEVEYRSSGRRAGRLHRSRGCAFVRARGVALDRRAPPSRPLRPLSVVVLRTSQVDLLSNPRIVKLGFAFSSDAAALRKACPSMRGFRRILALLEVGWCARRGFLRFFVIFAGGWNAECILEHRG